MAAPMQRTRELVRIAITPFDRDSGLVSSTKSSISEMDAMVSMADFRYNHPEAEEAEFVSGSPEADTYSDVSENAGI